jgi:hypothetical protein
MLGPFAILFLSLCLSESAGLVRPAPSQTVSKLDHLEKFRLSPYSCHLLSLAFNSPYTNTAEGGLHPLCIPPVLPLEFLTLTLLQPIQPQVSRERLRSHIVGLLPICNRSLQLIRFWLFNNSSGTTALLLWRRGHCLFRSIERQQSLWTTSLAVESDQWTPDCPSRAVQPVTIRKTRILNRGPPPASRLPYTAI